MAPATSILSVLDTRRSVISPPRRRRKFGSSFIVETRVRFAPVRGDPPLSGSLSRGRLLVRDAPAPVAARVGRRVDLRADPALERVDWVLTCADLPVAEWAESGSKVTRAESQSDRQAPPADPSASATSPKRRLPLSPLQLTCQRWPRRTPRQRLCPSPSSSPRSRPPTPFPRAACPH